MGWPGDITDYVRDRASEAADSARDQLAASTQDAVNGVDSLGSYKYLNPITAKYALYGDYKRGQENKDQDEAKAAAAEKAYQESLNNIGSIADYQDLISKDFDENKDRYTGLLQDASKRDLRGQLTDTLTKTTNNFNSRGLLNSGIQKFSEASSKAKADTDIQNADYENAQSIANQARDFKNQALSTRSAAQGGQNAKELADYKSQLSQMQAANESYNAIGQAGGQLAGAYIAKKQAGK